MRGAVGAGSGRRGPGTHRTSGFWEAAIIAIGLGSGGCSSRSPTLEPPQTEPVVAEPACTADSELGLLRNYVEVLDTSVLEHQATAWIRRDGGVSILDVHWLVSPRAVNIELGTLRPAPSPIDPSGFVPLDQRLRDALQAELESMGSITLEGVTSLETQRSIVAREIMRVPSDGPTRYDWAELQFYGDSSMTRRIGTSNAKLFQTNATEFLRYPFDPASAYWVSLSPSTGRGRMLALRDDSPEQDQLIAAILEAAAGRQQGERAPTVQQLNCQELESPRVFPVEQRHRLAFGLEFRDDGHTLEVSGEEAGSGPQFAQDGFEFETLELLTEHAATRTLSFAHRSWILKASVSFEPAESITLSPGSHTPQWVGQIALRDNTGYRWHGTVLVEGALDVDPTGTPRLGHLLVDRDEVVERDGLWSHVVRWDREDRSVRVWFGDRLQIDHQYVEGQSSRVQSWRSW